MPVFVAAADILVSPRRHGDNVPLKIFDYLEAGKPIVATDIPTHRTLLDDDRALLVGSSARDLAASISMLLLDTAAADRLGRAARRWSERHLGWESFRERVANLYHAAVTPSARPGGAAPEANG
jgi:glycosyltransferase involved in cell wall biosynthesis